MQCITLLLNDSEWRRISEVARLFWPNKVLDGQLSRNEATRRLLLTFGLDAMEGPNWRALPKKTASKTFLAGTRAKQRPSGRAAARAEKSSTLSR